MLLFYVFLALLLIGAHVQGSKVGMEKDRRMQQHNNKRYPRTKGIRPL